LWSKKLSWSSSDFHFSHLFAAAFLAISARRSGVMLSARFFPPLRLSSYVGVVLR
jgi:hypothetical protein